jgi:hypothetical protein
MAVTKLSDVIVPEVWVPYVQQQTTERSALVQSGIITSSPELDELVTGGGKIINMPFFNDLTGDDQVLPNQGSKLTVDGITTGQDKAVLLIRGKAWGAHELAGALAGADPMKAIADRYTAWWTRQEQKVLISVLTGVFGSALSSHVNDISSDTGAAAVISGGAVLDTKQALGDAADALTAIVMHSAVKTELQKQGLIEYVRTPEGALAYPSYLGYRVIVDDNMPVTGSGDARVYTTYLVGMGAIARGEGVPTSITPVETDRDSLGSEDYLITRRAFVLHPMGVAWKEPAAYTTATDPTPANVDLAKAANWQLVVDHKKVALAAIKHKLVPNVTVTPGGSDTPSGT